MNTSSDRMVFTLGIMSCLIYAATVWALFTPLPPAPHATESRQARTF